MYMGDWIERLDEFLKMTGSEVLDHAGIVSHEKALERASDEYEKYRESTKNDISRVETHFIDHIENKAKQLSTKKRTKKNA
ncbi:hypothetical protein BH20ACI2_BH20ACI2_24610 [soil metagenome]